MRAFASCSFVLILTARCVSQVPQEEQPETPKPEDDFDEQSDEEVCAICGDCAFNFCFECQEHACEECYCRGAPYHKYCTREG